MATWDEIYKTLFPALGDQGYRPVSPSALPDPTIKSFPTTGDSNVDSALIGATGESSWTEIARQLRQFSLGRGFAGMAIRRDKYDLEVVSARAFGSVLTKEAAEADLEHSWTIAHTLSKLVGKFELSEETKQAAAAAFEQYKSIHAPPQAEGEAGDEPVKPEEAGWDISQADIDQIRKAGAGAGDAAVVPANSLDLALKVALSVLHLLWDIASTSSATTVSLLVGSKGLSPELVAELEDGMTKTKAAFRMVAPSTSAVGIDCPAVAVHGRTPSGSLHLGKFGNSIEWYLRNGV